MIPSEFLGDAAWPRWVGRLTDWLAERPRGILAAVFLGEDLLAWLVLAVGAAMAVGTVLALVRPRSDPEAGELPRPPLGRSVVMIVVGTIAAVWGLASLIA